MSTTNSTAYELIDLGRLRPSPLNPRKHFDEDKLAELAASIREKGVLEPILVRPSRRYVVEYDDGAPAGQAETHPWYIVDTRAKKLADRYVDQWPLEINARQEAERLNAKDAQGQAVYDIAAGERRFRAAQLAGLDAVPCIVRELTDRELLEIAVIENEQRADTTPLEKAHGYQRLIDEHGYSADSLAEKLGKSKSYIYGLLKLTQLPPAAVEALESGTLAPSVAGLIARIPNARLREKATEFALKPEYTGELPSYRMVRARIEQSYMVELKGSPFRQDDAALHPSAGACTTCPHKTGNNRELYPDGRADVCTNPDCFRDKVALHMERLALAASEKGEQVLEAKEAEKLFSSYEPGVLCYNAPYYDLAEQCYHDREKKRPRSYKQLVGEECKADVVLAFDQNGKAHRLVPKAKADPVLVEKGILTKGGRYSDGNDSWKDRQREERKKKELESEAGQRLMGLVAADAERQARALLPVNNNSLMELLRIVVTGIVDRTWGDYCHRIKKRRALLDKGERSSRGDDKLTALVPELDAPELVGLLAEIVAAQKAEHWYQPDKEDKQFWAFFGTERKSVLAQVKKEKAAHKSNGHAGNGKAKKKQPQPQTTED